MTAGIVGNDGVRHAMLAELPGGERGALVAWARLVDPDMDRYPAIMRRIDRCSRGAQIHGGEKTGITMGQHVHRLARLLVRRDRPDQRAAVPADRPIDGALP